MSNFTPKKLDENLINGGQQYKSGDVVQPIAINDPIEAILLLQEKTATVDGDNTFTGENFFHNVTAPSYKFHIGTEIYSDESGNVGLYANNGGIIATTNTLQLATNELYQRVQSDIDSVEKQIEEQAKEIQTLYSISKANDLYAIATVEDTYLSRTTAGGINIIDGARTNVSRIVGKTVGYKNLLPTPYWRGDGEINGVTFTSNVDGSITLNGTATADVTLYLNNYIESMLLDVGYYTYSIGTTQSGVSGNVGVFNGTSFVTNLPTSFGVNKGNIDDGYHLSFNIYVVKGTVCNNLTVYPMLNYGKTALPYEKYYSDITNAIFAGIKSSSYNIWNTEGTLYFSNGNLYFEKGVVASLSASTGGMTFCVFDEIYPAGTYTVRAESLTSDEARVLFATEEPIDGTTFNSVYTNMVGINCYWKAIAQWSPYFVFTAKKPFRLGVGIYFPAGIRDTPAKTSEIQLVRGDVNMPYVDFAENAEFHYEEHLVLGEYDNVFPQDGLVNRNTVVYEFTGNEIFGYKSESGDVYFYATNSVPRKRELEPWQILAKNIQALHPVYYNPNDDVVGLYIGYNSDTDETTTFFWSKKEVDYWATREDFIAWLKRKKIQVAYFTDTTVNSIEKKKSYVPYNGGTEAIIGNEVEVTIEQDYYTLVEKEV